MEAEGLYDDATSDIHFRHIGDPISLTYLRKEPWVSTVKPWRWNLRQEIVWATLCLVTLLASSAFPYFISAQREQGWQIGSEPLAFSFPLSLSSIFFTLSFFLRTLSSKP